ncbi:MAG: C25 family cysteine peptidase [Candidatus Bathyarchaeota archaeon]|nr:C25 family cysteine peptidase [Candidatus Bathyarchaeota archaeon]
MQMLMTAAAPSSIGNESPSCDRLASQTIETKGSVHSKAVEKVAILVQKDEYAILRPYLKQYAADIADAFSFKIKIFKGSWSTPFDARSKLQKIYQSFNVSGCILVGNIPIAYYMAEYDLPQGHIVHAFPTDLYYMDLDGTWIDDNEDGIFEERIDPDTIEIWVSRIKTPIDDLNLIIDFFEKNHEYREGMLEVPHRVMMFQENDGEEWGPRRVEVLKVLYDPSNIVAVYHENETTKANYINTLNLGHEFLFVNSHGSPWMQYLKEPIGSKYFTYTDAKNIEKGCIFYLLFCCEVGKYDVNDYLAGWYVFGNSYGLAALASTTVWESIDPILFINKLNNSYVGEAFFEIIKYADLAAETDPIVARNLYYGATLIGDPILQLGD